MQREDVPDELKEEYDALSDEVKQVISYVSETENYTSKNDGHIISFEIETDRAAGCFFDLPASDMSDPKAFRCASIGEANDPIFPIDKISEWDSFLRIVLSVSTYTNWTTEG